MDGDFANILQNNFGLRPSGKNAPMGKQGPVAAAKGPASANGRPAPMGRPVPMGQPSPASSFGAPKDEPVFPAGMPQNGTSMGGDDFFGKPPRPTDAGGGLDDGLFGNLGPESRPQVNSSYGGDDIFGMGGAPTQRAAGGGYSGDDIFGGPPRPAAGGAADDLLGGYAAPQGANASPYAANGSFDDLLGGFAQGGGASPTPTPAAPTPADDLLGGFGSGKSASNGSTPAKEPVYDDLFGPPPAKQSPTPNPPEPKPQPSPTSARTKPAPASTERSAPQARQPPEESVRRPEVKRGNIPTASTNELVWMSVEDIVLLTQPTRAPPPVRRPPPIPGDPKVPEVAQRRRPSTTPAEPPRNVTPPKPSPQPARENSGAFDAFTASRGTPRRSSDGDRASRHGGRDHGTGGSGGSTPREGASGTTTPPLDPDFEAAANAAQASQDAMAAALERAAKKRAERGAGAAASSRAPPGGRQPKAGPVPPPKAKAAEPDFTGGAASRASPRQSWGSVDDLGNVGKKTAAASEADDFFGTSKARPASRSATNVADWGNAFGIDNPESDAGIQEGDSEERKAAKIAKAQRFKQRQEEALAEKKARDASVINEQEERHKCEELYGPEIKRWAAGKEGNLRAMLSTLQFVLWPECGWQPVGLTDLVDGNQVKRVYQKAILRIHPDKVQQKGANVHQKYIASKVFDLLKEAYNKFNSSELF